MAIDDRRRDESVLAWYNSDAPVAMNMVEPVFFSKICESDDFDDEWFVFMLTKPSSVVWSCIATE